MPWLITNKNTTTEGADAAREALRAAHRAYLTERRDQVILSGPLQSDDGSDSWGSMFLIQADSAEQARAFSAQEPFTQAGLYEQVSVTRVLKGLWNPSALG